MNPNLQTIKGKLATKNLTPGETVYGEKTIQKDTEYRLWKPERSKLASMIQKTDKPIKIKPHHKTLYLGAAAGTTASHLSDLQPEGKIYCIEYSGRTTQELINRTKNRDNIIPIQADANNPETYSKYIGSVDTIYQDITQKNQAEITNKNTQRYLKPDGQIILMIKARSIDVTTDPQKTIEKEIQKLKNIKIKQKTTLEPHHKDHMAIHGTYQPDY
ncbi:fibrillarin-like rRNA/tRNA 2'-O-methyltransferase [Methanonatronarchaeum sp. AMET6-2]|uniref:fibrillarin-like rRNA/tRNA 2'-O-methyltransferase n=1 Tax=Methanonatronarchaeum sp. AMET6-2 TaxID=2933293 RepID=UPI001FF1CE7C|nr:fibrillarin-like rRNA/tRNA 2'-O-methyltransferase [Methanonatronarchaeum sp. AMET6-2]UOY09639.1 fibrillarin-like rRNA/tRNA 2'-O-methyltransferase [Methanonatronarchaeum sp. AMET6-2]